PPLELRGHGGDEPEPEERRERRLEPAVGPVDERGGGRDRERREGGRSFPPRGRDPVDGGGRGGGAEDRRQEAERRERETGRLAEGREEDHEEEARALLDPVAAVVDDLAAGRERVRRPEGDVRVVPSGGGEEQGPEEDQ